VRTCEFAWLLLSFAFGRKPSCHWELPSERCELGSFALHFSCFVCQKWQEAKVLELEHQLAAAEDLQRPETRPVLVIGQFSSSQMDVLNQSIASMLNLFSTHLHPVSLANKRWGWCYCPWSLVLWTLPWRPGLTVKTWIKESCEDHTGHRLRSWPSAMRSRPTW